jgi:hypothetical protein
MNHSHPNGHRTPGRALARPATLLQEPKFRLLVIRLYCYFDKVLQPRVLEPTDWFVRINSRRQILTNALARTDRVQIDTHMGSINGGPDVVSYHGVIAKLRDVDGMLVEPFLGYPVTRT